MSFRLSLLLSSSLVIGLLACERPIPHSMRETQELTDRKAPEPAPALAVVAPVAPVAPPAVKAAPAVSEAAMTEAKAKFDSFCFTCHGASGKGDGPIGAALNPKPRDYTDSAWQDSVTDEYLAKVIIEGGMAVGKSPLMAASPDLKDKPEVIAGLVQIIRGFKGK